MKTLAVVGTIQEFKEVKKATDTNLIKLLHVYHEKCLVGATFDNVVCTSTNPYLLKVAEMAKEKTTP